MRQVVLWASWRLLGWVMAGVAVLVLLGWLASTLVLWWDTGTIAAAQLQKAQLQAQVAELQASYDGWVKAGMLGESDPVQPWQPALHPGERGCRAGSKARGTTTTG